MPRQHWLAPTEEISPDLLGVLTLESSDPRHDALFLANYAILRVLDNIKRLPGVGDALVFGAQSYAMRLILDPVRSRRLSLQPGAVVRKAPEAAGSHPAHVAISPADYEPIGIV
ncbi:MAG: efflux RND transporter permease subunit [Gammaproteobacteria bacterium]